ncbi:mucin-5AC-like [Alligator sinensis]|uniref:Mucin-5AC-like n=1 Tax=Alligator sinensis TaxID=38654 RepID=A0A3Q0GZS4_ALLSI|nr:mucin-5AC-like [Alligator sinensis]
MGFGRGIQVPIWALLLTVCFAQQEAFQATTPPGKVTIIQPMTTNPVITTLNPAHNGRVCSTWGNFHFKTFDGDIFHFPGLCNYIFASQCNAAYEDFNIQIRRTLIRNVPTISHIIMKLEGVITEITKDSVLVDSNRVQLPYSHSGILIEKNNVYIKVSAKMGLLFMWNEDDSILLEVAEKYANQTCGLCGDFNGIPKYNEFFSNDIQLSALQFGNMQKLDGPTEQCEDPTNTVDNCTIDYENMCRKTLTGPAFSKCNDLLAVNKYIESCVQDFCRCDQSNNAFCMCNTFAEYSRQCAHAGGQPQNWRTPQLCPKNCTFNMHYQECGSPCMDTCSNPETSTLCEEHCIDGCFCPPGTVFDDITTSGCIPLQQCSCTYNGNTYAPGTSYSGPCHNCTCTGGKWSCEDIPCPGTCSVIGGSHISTYDEKHYNVHGDCTYVLSRDCENDTFTILGELRKCGLTDTETCLKMIALITNKEQTIIVIKPDGGVFLNSFYTQLPISTADVTIFRPSSFFVIVHTNFGLQMEIQVTPFMQVFVRLDPSLKGQTCGLCGNFNNAQLDDFKIISGVVEGTGAAFANTWKTKPSCTDIKNSFENPCSLSVENEKYALHWCGMLTNSTGPFAACHATVNPSSYHTNCMFDTCNCEKSEDCMCASLSAYVRACAAKGVLLSGWRTNVCSKYTTTCPKSLSYSYVINSCQPTCQSLSEPDATCNIKFVPVDGCTCVNDTYMDESGKCVPASRCPCYYKGSLVPSGEVVHEDGHVCTCAKGVLNCIGTKSPEPVCTSPMVYFDCKNITAGTTGAVCQKSCQTLDMHCYSTQCVSGCMCPSGLVSDGKGDCITQEECPCVHNEAMYKPGEQIKVGCNTCECKNRMWSCTQHQCLGTCAVYGDGHYITFDGKRFSFNGNCEYTLVQDHCSNDGTANGTFRVITENIPCGTTGTTCSKSIKVFLGNYELILNEEHFQAVKRGDGQEVPYKVHYMGMYLVIETVNGLHLMWDKKTSIFIKLSPDFKGQVCGLCGNYDDNDINDFTTRSQSVVGAVLEFGNSWKISSSCPDAKCVKNPCSTNPYRKSWAEKQCSIINSDVFLACHPQVDAKKYYESCVTDACACDSGGDCECFCTAVAAYAQVCSEFGVCVAWRTPSICPMFCDYYNPKGECEWHYKPCGAPCMKTCRNPTGRCLNQFSGLEGCYPTCSPDKPYFNEHTMNCTDTCGCYDDLGNYVEPGKTYSQDSCQLCKCTQEGKINCVYEKTACYCIYEGKKYEYQEVIYNTTDGTGGCFSAVCDVNGTITRHIYICNTPTTTPPFEFSTPTTIVTGTTAIATATTVCVHRVCEWSEWYDTSHPTSGSSNGDYETIANLINAGHKICKTPNDIECRAAPFPNTSLQDLNQKVECSKTQGLICNNEDQHEHICYNYEIRIQCCTYIPCNPLKPTPAGTTMGYSTLTVTSIESTEVSKPTQTIGTEVNPKTTESQPTFSYNTTAVVTSGASPTTTSCEPTCAWTPWIDIDFPTSGPEGGDMETLSNIHAAGKPICQKPEKIQCRAQNYPDLSLAQLAQNVHCSLDSGLVCRNSEQTGKFKMCFNYEVQFWCCHANPNCITTLQTTTSLATPTPKPGTTTGRTSTSPPSLAPSTHPPASTSTTEGTTLIITSPMVEVVEPTKTTLVPTTARPTSTAAVTPTTPPGTTPEITPTTSAASTTSTLPTRGPTTAASTTRGFTTSETPTTTQSTPSPVPVTPTTTAVTSAASPTPASCEPTCAWTPWIDIDFPTSGPEGGDMETLSNIHAAGKPICHKPEKIHCRAQNYPDLSLAQLAQNVHCSLDSGLVCRNSEQTGKFKMCFNYEVQFWCCHTNPNCITTLKTTTSLATTTSTPAITTSIVFPTTTLATSRGKPSISIITKKPATHAPQVVGSTVSTLSTLVSTTTEGASIFSTSTQNQTTGGIFRTEETESSTASRTTACFCHVFEHLFSPGQVVYNRTDHSGCYFYALCNDKCEIDRFQGPCPTTIPSISSTTSPTTSGLSSPGSVSSTISPSLETSKPPPEGCPSLDPPRKINETWMSDKCTKATCVGNNTVVLELPPPVQVITCVNGREPVKVYEPDGCTYHYECECVCNGWSNSDYKTFDGVKYTFNGLCRYVLVKEIVPKYNFSVLTDNYNCDVVGGLSCPKSIIVNYNSMEIVLSSQTREGNVTNKIIFNKEPINEGVSKDGVSVTRVGKDLTVEIPAINAYISLNGLIFTVKVPFGLFAHNTEGQCGTCSNIKSDECRTQGGQEVSSCSEMAYTWKVENGNNPYCHETTTSSPPLISPTTPVPCTSSSPLCELILSDIFAECHKILPPRKFYIECLSESCKNTNDSLPCIILDKYSSLCIANGICADWRSKTQGKCSYSCPADKVYKACGPHKPVTCNERIGDQTIEGFVEGCFCPEGSILFNSFADVCVSECGCVGPDGLPREPGSKWKSNCQECVCDEKSMTVQCKPLLCQTPVPATCNKPGFVPMPVLTPDDPCCPEIICRCDITLCPKAENSCEQGYYLASVVFAGNCCVTYECVLPPNTCRVNGTSYQTGMLVPSDPCKNCTCSTKVDPVSKQNIVECEPVKCHTSCPPGYEYKTKHGKCCGECVQVACLISLDNSTSQVLKPGDTWTSQNNKCIYYECDKIEDQLITVEVRTPCPVFNPDECKPEDVQLTSDGCCRICKSDRCKVHKKPTVIYQDECKSSESIELTYCEGFCGSSSKYSLEANQMQHQCTCCQELKSHRRQVTLTCHNGTRSNYDYIYVEQCQCITACIPSESEDRTKQLQSSQIH